MADKKAEVETKLAEMHKWFKENPKLPEEIEPILLRRFLTYMEYDVEATKKVIELNYTMRNEHQQIFFNRDPDDEEVLRTFEIADIVPLPGLTPNRKKVVFFRKRQPVQIDSAKEFLAYHLIFDCRFIMNDTDEITADSVLGVSEDGLADGEVHICDITGTKISHMARMTFSIVRMQMKFLQEAYPMHLSEMHMINCPSYVYKMMSFFRPLLRDEVIQRTHFHTEDLDTLYEYVPRDMLPEEYGGKAGKIPEMKEKLIANIRERREYLIDPKYWKVEKEAEPARKGWLWW